MYNSVVFDLRYAWLAFTLCGLWGVYSGNHGIIVCVEVSCLLSHCITFCNTWRMFEAWLSWCLMCEKQIWCEMCWFQCTDPCFELILLALSAKTIKLNKHEMLPVLVERWKEITTTVNLSFRKNMGHGVLEMYYLISIRALKRTKTKQTMHNSCEFQLKHYWLDCMIKSKDVSNT